MITGKLPNDLLEEIIFKYIKHSRDEVIIGASVGQDNALVDFGKEVAVLSTDPITGAVKDVGRLAIEISVNDVASSGGEPIGVLITILAPRATSYKDIEYIMKDAGDTAKRLNVEIMGGHTEITDAVNKLVVSTTVIGKIKKKNIMKLEDIKKGYKILMTKSAAIEGTSIILNDYEDFFKDKISQDLLEEGKNYIEKISVKKEGKIAGKFHVNYMHDITEGGVLGAVWEAHKAIGRGIKIDEEKIPVTKITKEITSLLKIDYLRLISSGSMLIIGSEANIANVKKELKIENIDSSIIGEIIDEGLFLDRQQGLENIEAPKADELYRAIEKLNRMEMIK